MVRAVELGEPCVCGLAHEDEVRGCLCGVGEGDVSPPTITLVTEDPGASEGGSSVVSALKQRETS